MWFVFPDSVSFFSDAEKLIIPKKTENEGKKNSLHGITAHLSQDSSKVFLPVGCIFLCAAFQYSREAIQPN